MVMTMTLSMSTMTMKNLDGFHAGRPFAIVEYCQLSKCLPHTQPGDNIDIDDYDHDHDADDYDNDDDDNHDDHDGDDNDHDGATFQEPCRP